MTKPQFFIYVLVFAVGAAIAAPIGIHFLDQATARQCKKHDWPIKADRVHKDWCVDNGYQI